MKNFWFKTSVCALLLATATSVYAQKKKISPLDSNMRGGYGFSTGLNPYMSVGVDFTPKNFASDVSMHADMAFFTGWRPYHKFSQVISVNQNNSTGEYILGLAVHLRAQSTISISNKNNSVGIGVLFAEKVSYSSSISALVPDEDKAITSTGFVPCPCIKVGRDITDLFPKLDKSKGHLQLEVSASYIPETKNLRTALHNLDNPLVPVTVGLVYTCK